jgi:DNA invertase Pin-like site-specific DNA recombinase
VARKSRKHVAVVAEPEYSFTMYETAVYVRLSVEDNKNRGNSVESQKSIIENFIAINPDLKLCDVYIDNGSTGQNFERPEFKRMIADIESGKVNCVVVKDLSRLGRNGIDSGYYIEIFFPAKNTRFISVNDNYDSADSKNKNGSIVIPLKNMINEAYALDIARKVRAQAHQSMKAGDYIGSRQPYGYMKDPNNCHKLIVDDEAAPVVRQIFEWVCDDVGVNTIARWLNEQGVLSPGLYFKKKYEQSSNYNVGNGIWKALKVNRMICDEVYIGNMVQGKKKSVNKVQFAVPESEWIRVDNTHEPIISREVFELANAKRKIIKEKYSNLEIEPYTENIFKGIIFCKHCNTNLHRQRGHKKYYFTCLSNSRTANGSCKSEEKLREEDLISTVASILQKKAEVLLSNNSSLLKAKSADSLDKTKITALNQGIENNRKYLKSLYENLVNGNIDDDDYSAMKAVYEQKITSALEEIKKIEVAREQNKVRAAHIKDLSKNAVITADNLSAKLINKLIEQIDVDSDMNIEITMRFEDEFNLESEGA